MTQPQLHLIQGEFVTISEEWNARDVCSSFWRLYINNRGGSRIWSARGAYELPGGRIHLIPAYFRFSCQNATAIQHLYMHFDVVGITPLLQKRLFAAPLSLPLTNAGRKLLRMYGDGANSQRSPAILFLAHSLLWDCLSQIIGQLTPEDQELLQSEMAESSPLRPALQLVEQHLPHGTAVPPMARACQLSNDHFIRAFRQTMGQTPARYVLEKRLSLAARELLFGSASIDSIAQRHGFANRFHFSRAFTRVMGTTPAAYRRTARV